MLSRKLQKALLVCAGISFAAGAMRAQTITVVPTAPTVSLGSQTQFSAHVTGLTPDTVSWSVSGGAGIGSISATGLYQAPASVPGQNPITVTATSTVNTTIQGSVYVYLVAAGPTITQVSPNPITVGNYTVTITGSGFLPGATILGGGVALVTNSITNGGTTISASGYQGAATSTTFSVKNPLTGYGNVLTVPVTTTPPAGTAKVTISPGYLNIGVNMTQQYTATVTGLPATTVVWKVSNVVGGNSTVGTIDATGLYTAPAQQPPPNTSVLITATSTSNTSIIGAVYVNILGPGPVITSVTPNPIPSGSVTLKVTGTGILPGAAIVLSGVQMGATGTTTTTNVSGIGYQGATGTTSLCVRNPNTVCSNVLTVPVTATTGGGGGGGGSPSKPTVVPASVAVVLGTTQQFTGTNVTSWATVAGTVTPAGLYTAPAVMPASGTDTVTVTGAGGTAVANIQLITNTPPVIQTVNPSTLPLGVFTFTLSGTGFIPQSLVKMNGVAVSTSLVGGSLVATGFSGAPGTASITVSNGPIVSQPVTVQVGVANPLVSAGAARRFLEQAAFGPSPTDAAHVQAVGFQGWLNEQFAMPVVSNFNGVGNQSGMTNYFLTNAVMNSDQLRQRVAFALSEIFVVSLTKEIWTTTVAPFEQMLMADAFTSYPTILQDVTLSPAMGDYLDMVNNAKANPAAGTVANENFAREVLQLFSVGTYLLNQDGTQQKDASNLSIPTYNQFTITEFARAFTGWAYSPVQPNGPVIWKQYINPNGPLVPYNPQHDFGSKTLLNGYVSPAGVSVLQDMQNALNNIATHPNVAPFISKQLIEHLVKSNPSPTYVKNVADVFVQTNGDMKAIVTAILLDPEARANDIGGADLPTDGHLQEPALFLPGIVRAFGGTMTNQNYFSSDMAAQGQDIYNSPSVFNYFSPFYTVAGTGGLKGPEFQINNPNAAILRENMIASLINSYSNPVLTYGPGTTIDVSPFVAIAANPATLVDALDLTLTHGTMPAAMKTIVLNAVTADNSSMLHRVETGMYLIMVSSYYNVWH